MNWSDFEGRGSQVKVAARSCEKMGPIPPKWLEVS